MLFNSFQFVVFFPLICVLYYAVPRRLSKLFLLIVSYLLYMNWIPSYALMLLYVTVVTYYGALSITTVNESVEKKRKYLIVIYAIMTLFPLLLFKYYNFINDNVDALLSSLNLKMTLPGLNWAIPVGISFFTFQAYGYMMDVYNKKIEPERNFLNYLLFVSFFPQIASGPISKGNSLLPQINDGRKFNENQIVEGMRLMLWGMFMKVVLADRIAIYANTVLDNYMHQNGISCFVASLCYTVQIYGDFAGYSLLAVGTGKVMGFDLINNFNRPYFSASITEFWRRWHISLSTWLKDYVYIPLGGSRCTKLRSYVNIITTFLVSGLWHGANWTFLFWGLLHGFLQVLEKLLGMNNRPKRKGVLFFRVLLTFLLVSFAWISFRMPTLSDALSVYMRIFTDFGGKLFIPSEATTVVFIIFALILLIIKEITDEIFPGKYCILDSDNGVIRWSGYISMVVIILLLGVFDAGQFIYVSF